MRKFFIQCMILRIGKRYVVVPKLLGLLLALMSVLFFLGATMDLVVSWDKIKDVKTCLKNYNSTNEYLLCSVKAVAAGVYPFPTGVDYFDKFAVLAYKSGVWVFWVFVLVVSLLLYQTGKLLEFTGTIEVKEEEEKKTRRGRKRKSK